MLDELKLEAEASPTVDQDRLLFSASLGDSPEGGHRGDRRVIGQALFRPRFWTLGPWNTEPSGNRPPHPPAIAKLLRSSFKDICQGVLDLRLAMRRLSGREDHGKYQRFRGNKLTNSGFWVLLRQRTWTSHISQCCHQVINIFKDGLDAACSMPRAGILRRGPPPLAVLSVQGQFGLFRVCCFKFLRLRIRLQLQRFGLRSHQLSRHPPARIPGPPNGQAGGGGGGASSSDRGSCCFQESRARYRPLQEFKMPLLGGAF